jgi:hypothetical protein
LLERGGFGADEVGGRSGRGGGAMDVHGGDRGRWWCCGCSP